MIHLYEIIFYYGGKISLLDCETNELVERPEMILKPGMNVRVFEREIELVGNIRFNKIITKSIYLEYIE